MQPRFATFDKVAGIFTKSIGQPYSGVIRRRPRNDSATPIMVRRPENYAPLPPIVMPLPGTIGPGAGITEKLPSPEILKNMFSCKVGVQQQVTIVFPHPKYQLLATLVGSIPSDHCQLPELVRNQALSFCGVATKHGK